MKSAIVQICCHILIKIKGTTYKKLEFGIQKTNEGLLVAWSIKDGIICS